MNMEISKEQLNKLIELSGYEIGAGSFDNLDISKALIEIERKLNVFNSGVSYDIDDALNILVVDDLELSIYQFSHLLKRVGITPTIARNKEEAIAEILKNPFDYVVIDLFLPSPEDGMELICKSVEARKQKGFKLIVISSTDDKQIIDKCYELGIDEFIPKTSDWHEAILKYITNTVKKDNPEEFSKYAVNNDILVYTLYKLNNQKSADLILQEVNSSVFTGNSKIIFNLDKLRFFDPEFVYIFTEVYKACSDKNGTFAIMTSSYEVKEALENAFLDGVIPVCETIEDIIYQPETNSDPAI